MQLLLLTAIVVGTARAWWDEGHMLVASIAKQLLSSEQIAAIERPLQTWDKDFLTSVDMVSAAVWPDHIKCWGFSPICSGFQRIDALGIFDPWHYVMIPFNPQNLTLDEPYKNLPWPGVGATSALRQLSRGPWRLESWDTFSLEDHVFSRPGRHAALEEDVLHNEESSLKKQPLSVFSWNIRLRFIIHSLGDIHQPLHTMETFVKSLPHGDRGGNNWHVKTTDGKVMALHGFWDSCGGLFDQDWPVMPLNDVETLAAKLMEEFPPSTFGERLNVNSYEGIAADSYQIGAKFAYTFVNITDPEVSSTVVHNLTPEYEEAVRKECRQQIVLGGYRLSQVLIELYNAVLSTWTPPSSDMKSSALAAEWNFPPLPVEPKERFHGIKETTTEHHAKRDFFFNLTLGVLIGVSFTLAVLRWYSHRQGQQPPERTVDLNRRLIENNTTAE